jgi:hypothetical protein
MPSVAYEPDARQAWQNFVTECIDTGLIPLIEHHLTKSPQLKFLGIRVDHFRITIKIGLS